MNVCAVPFPPDVDELAMAGLTAVKGVHVGLPAHRRGAGGARMPPLHDASRSASRARSFSGLVLGCFVREGAVNPITKHVDQRKMDAIGRLGGHGYSRIRDQFDLPTMSVEEWRRREGAFAGVDEEGRRHLACWRPICFVRESFDAPTGGSAI